MKITKSQLKQIIKEEIESSIEEGAWSPGPPRVRIDRETQEIAQHIKSSIEKLDKTTRAGGARKKLALKLLQDLRDSSTRAVQALDQTIAQKDAAWREKYGEGYFGPDEPPWEHSLSEVSSETHRCSIDTGEGYWDRSIKSAAECKRAGGKWVDLKKFLGKFGEAREKDT